MGARGRSKAKSRSLADLLFRQPAALKKTPRFKELVALLNASAALQRARLEPRAYRLLAAPRLKPENLVHFYRTYSLPVHDFFPVFLELKWTERKATEARRAERADYIAARMQGLAPHALSMLEWLAAVEAQANPGMPLWKARFEPRSKKGANELAAQDREAWRSLFSAQLTLLRARYPSLALPPDGLILDCWELGCLPDPRTQRPPDAERLRKAWRSASKREHPDGGGDPARFRAIDQARKRLGL